MVFAKLSTDKVRFLVLEAQQKSTVLRSLYEQADVPKWLYLFAETDWQQYLAESPVVLEAKQKSPEYQWALQGLKEGRLVGLILESSESLESVTSWLRARLKVRFDGERQGLLRLYDPEVWQRLSPVTLDQADVIERVIYWFGESGQERWHTTDRPNPFTMLPLPTLSETQWQKLNTADV
ncbi:hypothetical protein DOQ08_02526 [Marinobacter litoralis]|uniref:DUF4123 domain-containing protein n=1 Tax=Marinobacter litoralis TaxID=187981 RepID=A0A3M2RCN9_9GAMM|nr:DUF4123 domain-containing protein [Marinobacter litoralis]RMJ03061.1 hypothetical protein DOQ08_02526 [Marinobacter litoralis]